MSWQHPGQASHSGKVMERLGIYVYMYVYISKQEEYLTKEHKNPCLSVHLSEGGLGPLHHPIHGMKP